MLVFEWSAEKSRTNRKKHGVSFEEAKSTFFDEFAVQFFDSAHSMEEDRFIMLGMSRKLRILVVVHCEREKGKVIRIISARKATSNECEYYLGAPE